MKEYVQKAVRAGIPVAAWLASVAVPAVPAFVWAALFNGILDEKITLQHITDFMKEHDIHTYSNPEDFPPQKGNFTSVG